jgi:hypothetical protein
MARVEHPQLVELPVVDAISEERADIPGGTAEMKRSSITHWGKDSQTTGQPSSTPTSSRSHARSSSFVCGVIRSTIEFGNVHDVSTYRASSAPRLSSDRRDRLPSDVTVMRERLSQLRIVTG